MINIVIAAFTLLVTCAADISDGYASQHPTILNYGQFGASCAVMKYKAGKESKISFYLDNVVTDQTNLNELKIPYLIFHYTDITNYENLPLLEKYYFQYAGDNESKNALYKNLIDFESSKFDLKRVSGDYTQKEVPEITDYLVLDTNGEANDHVDVSYTVEESGIYCVYIAPPTDKSITELAVPIKFQNYYGNLPYLSYEVYSIMKYVILVGCILFAYLFYYILRFKTDKDFKNLNSISIISKAVIFYVLFPIISITTIEWIILFIRNFVPSSSAIGIMNFFGMGLNWIFSCFNIMLNYFILMFSMGYGVIYYHKGSSFRQMPSSSVTTAKRLLLSNIIIFTIGYLFTYYGSTVEDTMYGFSLHQQLWKHDPQLIYASVNSIGLLFTSIAGIFPLIWFVYTLIHYFKTKAVISKFSPVSTEQDNSYTNEKIISSFKKSILVIFVLPFLIAVLFFAAFMFKASRSTNWNDLIKGELTNADEETALSVLEMEVLERVILSGSTIPFIWLMFLNSYLAIILIYAIWIKDNNGLVLDKETDFEIEEED